MAPLSLLVAVCVVVLALSGIPAALALSGIYQLQPTSDVHSTPPIARASVHVRHCQSIVSVTEYATAGPKDDFKFKFEDALDGTTGAVSIRVTTEGYTTRYLSAICDATAVGVEPGRICTSVPTADVSTPARTPHHHLISRGWF